MHTWVDPEYIESGGNELQWTQSPNTIAIEYLHILLSIEILNIEFINAVFAV